MKLSKLSILFLIFTSGLAEAKVFEVLCLDESLFSDGTKSQEVERRGANLQRAGASRFDSAANQGINVLSLTRVSESDSMPNWEGRLAIKNRSGKMVTRSVSARLTPNFHRSNLYLQGSLVVKLYDDEGNDILFGGEEKNQNGFIDTRHYTWDLEAFPGDLFVQSFLKISTLGIDSTEMMCNFGWAESPATSAARAQ